MNMANYPATPSFGGPFRFSNQVPQHHGAALGMPQLAYQQPPAFNQALPGAPGTHAGVGSANAFAFNANTHGFVNPYPGNGVPPPPPPPPPGFPPFSHFPNGSVPPPPFPPIPIPRYGSVAQQSATADISQRTMNSFHPPILPSTLPPKPPPVSIATANTELPPRTIPIAAGVADREDGELSDADMSRTTREFQKRNAISPISSSQNRDSNDANGVNQRDERQNIVSPITHDQEGSISPSNWTVR